MVTAPAEAIPERWPLTEVRRWHWMLTTHEPEPPSIEVATITDAEEVTGLIDDAAPGSHARPGTPGIVAWLGIRDAGRLVAVGAALHQPDGTGHVRGVAVAEGIAAAASGVSCLGH